MHITAFRYIGIYLNTIDVSPLRSVMQRHLAGGRVPHLVICVALRYQQLGRAGQVVLASVLESYNNLLIFNTIPSERQTSAQLNTF